MKHFFLIAAALCLSLSVGAQTLHYPHPFQPAQGLVKSHEQPFRSELCLNGAWEFMPLYGATAEDFRRPANFMPEITPGRKCRSYPMWISSEGVSATNVPSLSMNNAFFITYS